MDRTKDEQAIAGMGIARPRTGDKRQCRDRSPVQEITTFRRDDLFFNYDIFELVIRRLDQDGIAGTDFVQTLEPGVAVGGNRAVAAFARQSGLRQMPRSFTQGKVVHSLDNHCIQTNAVYSQMSEGFPCTMWASRPGRWRTSRP